MSVKKWNPYHLIGTDACQSANPTTDCAFRRSPKVLRSELLPGQRYCGTCPCELQEYEKQPLPLWYRWVALGAVALLLVSGAVWWGNKTEKPAEEPPKTAITLPANNTPVSTTPTVATVAAEQSVVTSKCDGCDQKIFTNGKLTQTNKKSKKCGYISYQPPSKCFGGEIIEYAYDACGARTLMHSTGRPCQ